MHNHQTKHMLPDTNTNTKANAHANAKANDANSQTLGMWINTVQHSNMHTHTKKCACK